MPTLHILRFRASRWLPKNVGHWGLFLQDEGSATGVVFEVRKRTLTSKQTVFQHRDYDPQSSSLRSSLSIPEIDIVPHVLSTACHAVTNNRPFHLVNYNCQHWVYEVIEDLIIRLQIADGANILNRIKKLGYLPFREFKRNRDVYRNSDRAINDQPTTETTSMLN